MIKWFIKRFIKKRYIVLTLGGTSCIFTPVDAIVAIRDSDEPKDFKITSKWITEYKFEKLPEFSGW